MNPSKFFVSFDVFLRFVEHANRVFVGNQFGKHNPNQVATQKKEELV